MVKSQDFYHSFTIRWNEQPQCKPKPTVERQFYFYRFKRSNQIKLVYPNIRNTHLIIRRKFIFKIRYYQFGNNFFLNRPYQADICNGYN